MLQNIHYSVDTKRTILYQPQCRKSHIWIEVPNMPKQIDCLHTLFAHIVILFADDSLDSEWY